MPTDNKKSPPKRGGTRLFYVLLAIISENMRHEFATLCLDAGLDAADTQEIMGHASISTTQAVYQHITDSRRTRSFDKLEKFMAQK